MAIDPYDRFSPLPPTPPARYHVPGGPPAAMYQPPKPPSLWSEFWTLSRIVYGILFWPLLALFAVLLTVFGVFVLYTIHPAFALLAILAIAAVIAVLAWWESHRIRPPGA